MQIKYSSCTLEVYIFFKSREKNIIEELLLWFTETSNSPAHIHNHKTLKFCLKCRTTGIIMPAHKDTETGIVTVP